LNSQLRHLVTIERYPAPSPVQIEPWTTIHEEWSSLVTSCAEATIYQQEPWLTALTRAYGFELTAVTLRDPDGRLDAASLFARGKNPFSRKWTSLPCSDSSPPLARDPEARERLLAGVAESRLADEGIVEIRGCAAPEPWKTVNCFAQWRLDLDRPLDAIERGMAPNFRRQLHRGLERPLVIDVDRGLSGLRRFHRLNFETRRRLGLPAQPWRFFKSVFEAFEPSGEFEVWTAAQDDRTVAAMVIVRDGDDLHYKWSARTEPTPPGATHRLLTAVCEKYAQRCRWMDLGRTDVRNVGLSRFKKEAGAKPHSLPYSFLPRVPARVSPEVLGKSGQVLARAWRLLPIPISRILGSFLYRYIV
jgi:hypothetical protein